MPPNHTTQVIIVGAGPTGLTLAAMLRRYGVDFVLLDQHEGITRLSKAMVVHARSMEIFQELGLTQNFLDAGQVTERINIITQGRIKEVVELKEFGQGQTQFPYVLTIEQSRTEAILADHLMDREGVYIRWECELLSVENGDDEVRATYRDAHGEQQVLVARYLVGCDGAGSTVRHQLGLHFDGDTEAHTFYVADVRIDSAVINKKEGYLNLTEGGLVLLFGLEGDRHYRIIGVLPEHLTGRSDVTFADVRDTIREQVRTPLTFLEESWFSTYRVHSRMAETFHAGRCFLAGDASHVHTPAGGQGMNTGIQDAYNLAWKLAFVLQGRSRSSLLDTYNQERMANARHLLATTDREFRFMMGGDQWTAFLRMYVFPFVVKVFTTTHIGNKEAFAALAQLSITYPDSALTIPGTLGSVSAGDRMPDFVTQNGHSIYRFLHQPDYKLLWFGPEATLEQYELDLPVPRFPVESVPEVFGGETEFFVVLRPDNHIAYLGDDVEEVRRAVAVATRVSG